MLWDNREKQLHAEALTRPRPQTEPVLLTDSRKGSHVSGERVQR